MHDALSSIGTLPTGVPRCFKQLPDEWLHVDGDESLGVHLDQAAAVSEVLNLPFADPAAFWNQLFERHVRRHFAQQKEYQDPPPR